MKVSLKKLTYYGFGHVESLFVLAAVFAVMGAGLFVYNRNHVSHAADFSDYVATTGWSPGHTEDMNVYACRQTVGKQWDIQTLLELTVGTTPTGGPIFAGVFDSPSPSSSSGGHSLASNLNSWLYGVVTANDSYVNPNVNNYISWTMSTFPAKAGAPYWYVTTPSHRAGSLKVC